MDPTNGKGNAIATGMALAALLVFTLVAFWGAWSAPFHFDDSLFLDSPQVTTPGDVLQLIRPAQTRQLTYLTFYLNYRLGGTSPWSYHLVNLLLHLANSLMVYLFVRLLINRKNGVARTTSSLLLPVAAAGVFALHPVQTEAVNYVYQRSTLLAAFFSLLALCFYLLSEETPNRRAARTAAVLFLLLAGASKESAWILPAVFLAYLWANADGRRSLRSSLLQSPFFWGGIVVLMPLGIGWAYFNLQRSGDQTVGSLYSGVALRYLVNQTQAFATYLRLLLWPSGLSVDHDLRVHPLWSPYGIYCLALLLGMLTLAARVRRLNPTAAFLSVSFILLLVPTSSFIPSSDLLFEHRLYLPMIAASALVAWGLITLCVRLASSTGIPRPACLALVGVVFAVYAGISRERTNIWSNDVRLWTDAAAKAPRKTRVHYNLGVAYLEADREKAREEFLEVTRLSPNHAAALYNLGWIDQSLGRYDSARSYYMASIRADGENWRAHQNLGNLAVIQGHFNEAISEYETTIRIHPDYWPAYQSLATLQLQEGSPTNALATLGKLKALHPGLLEERYLTAYALAEIRRFGEAEAELRSLETADVSGAYGQRIEDLRRHLGVERRRP